MPWGPLVLVGRTQQCSTTYSAVQVTQKVANQQFAGILPLSWNCPARLVVHLIFLFRCMPQGRSCIVNSGLLTPTLFNVSPSVAKLTLFPAKLTSFPFFDRVTKLEGFWEYCRHSVSGFCKGDDKVPWSLCGQNGQAKWERGWIAGVITGWTIFPEAVWSDQEV